MHACRKFTLIDRLAESAKLVPVPFNLTHLNNRAEIVGWFDELLSRQRRHPGKRLLVFIDEINAEIAGEKSYSAFLSPLEDGEYVRNGQIYELEPCVWIFAGTRGPLEKNGDKGSDFVSRLTFGLIDLSPATERVEAELENIYVGAALLRHTFPDVRRASHLALQAFRYLPSDVKIRDIKHFVRNFRNVQYTEVTSANVPEDWPGDRDGAHRSRWQEICKSAINAGETEELLEIAL